MEFFDPSNNSEVPSLQNWGRFSDVSSKETKPVITRIVTKWSIFKNDIVLNGACLKIFLFLRSSSFARLFLETIYSSCFFARHEVTKKKASQKLLTLNSCDEAEKVVDLYQKNYTLYTLGTQMTPLILIVLRSCFGGLSFKNRASFGL